ncbi:MAG: tRNA-binding protein [Bacteroidota bacterium]|jgi:tRNA-binding protein
MKPIIEATQFHDCMILAGTVISANVFPEALKPAYQLEIDFGPYGIRKSSAQITKLYDPEGLMGLQVIALVNIPARRIAGFDSECLVLGALGPEGDVVLLTTERKVQNGSEIA